ncbi:hypothetical protein HSB1_37570 [Halogranum salarium B-1]|uniref:Uncharacterized protein n=1 Tax=Halogranum salarium B-1 TaxID=1210908 RepID=J2ZCD7_9EURY|nr:hypothetical protein HSB1_37570 [Halogranum salarium B-1]
MVVSTRESHWVCAVAAVQHGEREGPKYRETEPDPCRPEGRQPSRYRATKVAASTS